MKINGKILTAVLVFAIFALALFLRIYPSYANVMTDPVKYSADDGTYHMRLVENELLGNHFPWRIYFDPFTNFPYGTYIHFGPLYDFIICSVVWLVSLGHPTIEIINKVSPIIPAVMGSLVIFLVYFIARKIWTKPIAVLAALLIALMPNFMFRSLLANTDHHVAEVFFSTLTMLFLAYLVSSKGWKFWLFAVLAGISLGLYFLSWTGALLFLFIIFCFFVFYYLAAYFWGQSQEKVLWAGGIIFFIALLMILPFFGYPDFLNGRIYSIQHFLCFAGGGSVFILLGALGHYLKKKNKKPYWLLVYLLVIAILGAVVLKLFVPLVWDSLIGIASQVNIGMVKNSYARSFIGEMGPIRISGLFAMFSSFFLLSVISFGIIVYKFIKQRKPEYLLMVVWTAILLFVSGIIPAFGQNRNSYYLCVVFSLLAAYVIVEGFKLGWNALRKAKEFPQGSYLNFYFYTSSIIVLFTIICLVFYPFPFNIGNVFPSSMPDFVNGFIAMSKGSAMLSQDWYDTLFWLRDNTPDPGLDYYELYKAPEVDKSTGKVKPYNYPEEAYGILASWDVGHDITYYSHRIPVANPFQEGIGYINNDGSVEPGQGTFLLETDESKATGYLDQLKTKYVIVDSSYGNPNGIFRGYVKWINANMDDYAGDNISETEPTKFDLAMSTRLYFSDGSFMSINKKVDDKDVVISIPQLQHFRLVYESKSDNSIFWQQEYKTTKQIKVFEYVKGAKIKGWALTGSKISISTQVKTNQKRVFNYTQEIVAKDNAFEFIVPYAQKYTIDFGNYTRSINVLENQVSNGELINL